jgi:hypothetical protein
VNRKKTIFYDLILKNALYSDVLVSTCIRISGFEFDLEFEHVPSVHTFVMFLALTLMRITGLKLSSSWHRWNICPLFVTLSAC